MGEILEPISPELVLVDSELARTLRSPSAIPFRVVFVCTGNRFRSVLAAAAFRSVAVHLPVEVDSCGTLDVGAAQPLPEAMAVAAMYGLDLSGHVTKSLSTADLSHESLVVGFEPRHMSAAVEIAGARAERTFLLRELNELLDHVDVAPTADPIARAIQTIVGANVYRRLEPRRWVGREIGDPMGLTQPEQHAIGQAVCGGAIMAAQKLFGSIQ